MWGRGAGWLGFLPRGTFILGLLQLFLNLKAAYPEGAVTAAPVLTPLCVVSTRTSALKTA